MAEFPALPLWTDAYLADTRHLSTIEHGAYLLLLMEAWRRPTCSLPDDDVMLARLAQMTADEWRQHGPIVMAFWKRDGRTKTWQQKRLKKQRDVTRTRSKSQSDKAVKRWEKEKNPDAAAMPQQSRGNASITIPTVAKATGGKPPQDPVKALFDDGVALLTDTGTLPGPARALIGKWRKARGDEWVARAIAAARTDRISEPVAWIEARLRRGAADEETRSAYNNHIIEQARRMRETEASAGEGRR